MLELWNYALPILPLLSHFTLQSVLVRVCLLLAKEIKMASPDEKDHANGNGYVIVPRLPATDPQKVFHYTDLQRTKPTRANDPYEYLCGFGNRHQSEVIPGTLPAGQNNPQENRFGLYTEGITYSAFAAPRHSNYSTYMYRVRPAAAHSESLLFFAELFPASS